MITNTNIESATRSEGGEAVSGSRTPRVDVSSNGGLYWRYTIPAVIITVLAVTLGSQLYQYAIHPIPRKMGAPIVHDTRGTILLAVSEQTLREYVAGDEAKRKTMINDGAICPYPREYTIRLKSHGAGPWGANDYEVVMYEGTYAFASGWTDKAWLTKPE